MTAASGCAGRFFGITTHIYESYLIFFNKQMSTWQKVCGIVPRLLGLTTDSIIFAKLNKQVDALKAASFAIDKVIVPLADIALQDKEQSYITPMLQAAANAVGLADNLGIIHVPKELYYLNDQIWNKSKASKVFLTHLYKKIMDPPIKTEVDQLIKYLDYLKTDPLQTIQKSIHDHTKIYEGASAADLSIIPYCVFQKEKLQKRTCTIRDYPIREAVVVKETPSSPPVYYELFFLLGWYIHVGTLPKGWPESIPFTRDVIVVDKMETEQITKDLQWELDHIDKDCVKQQLTAMHILLKEFS